MSEPPFGPDDLKDPPLNGGDFVEFLQNEKKQKFPTPPAFYQLLYGGKLNPEQLKLWVKDMYVLWRSWSCV